MSDKSGFQVTGSAAESYEAFSSPIMRPFVAALVRYVNTGDTVLDLACGTGYATEAAAERAGAPGTAEGVDINPAMLEVARRKAMGRFAVHRAPADALPFADARFDIVICQQGLQFFPDPRAALDEVVRVLRPGGQFAATFWTAQERLPYMSALHQCTADIVGHPTTGDTPDRAFTGDPQRFVDVATEAGLVDVTAEEVMAEATLPPLPEYAVGHMGALPWSSGLDVPTTHTIATAVTERLSDYRTPDGGARIPFVSHLLRGKARS